MNALLITSPVIGFAHLSPNLPYVCSYILGYSSSCTLLDTS